MSRRVLVIAALLVETAAVPAGCASEPSMSGDASGPDGAAPDAPAGDALAPSAHLVIVNAMDKALAALSDTDVRVCLGSSSNDRPLPEDPSHPIPESNYPGIPLGGGIDLGNYPTPATLYVISAKLQSDNYPGSPTQVGCNEILSTGPTAKPYLTVSVPFASGSNRLVVLLDGEADGGAAATAATLDDVAYGPSEAGLSVFAQLGAFGPWARQPISVDLLDPSDAATTIAILDGASLSPPPSIPIEVSPATAWSLRFTSPSAAPTELVQSFQSIQSVSDPTTSPSVFYGGRGNFLFLLLGTPGGADASPPSFEDRGLHIVAVPYVP